MRSNLKIKLPDSPPAFEAVRITNDWKRRRLLSRNIVNAIRLYASLLQGDMSVLTELFPGFAMGSSIGYRPQQRRAFDAPLRVETVPAILRRIWCADVAKLADAQPSEGCDRKVMEVQLLSSAPTQKPL